MVLIISAIVYPAAPVILKGKVVLDDGKTPAPGIRVQVEHHENRNALNPDDFLVTQLTDSNGLFEISVPNKKESYMLFVYMDNNQPLIGFPHIDESRDFGVIPVVQECELSGQVRGPGDVVLTNVEVLAELRLIAGCSHYIDAAQTITDAEGMFAFTELSTQTYRIRVKSPGYTSGKNNITVSDDLNYMELVVETGGELHGIVVDKEKSPVARARVLLDGDEAAVSDEQGIFTITGLEDESYDIRITADGMALPGNKEVEIDAKPGKVIKKTFKLVQTGDMCVSVTTEAEDVQMPDKLEISLEKKNDWRGGYDSLSSAVSASGAAVYTNLAPGKYTLNVENENAGVCTAPVTIKSDETAQVSIVLPRVIPFIGIVKDDAGNVLEGADIRLIPKRRLRKISYGGIGRSYVSSDETGMFSMAAVVPGDYTLKIEHEQAVPLSEKITVDQKMLPTNVFILKRGLCIVGRIVDENGNGILEADVTIRGTRDTYKSIETGTNGVFEISGLQPGRFVISAEQEEQLPGRETMNIDTDITNVVMVLKSGFSLSGYVFDQATNPVESAEIHVSFSKMMEPIFRRAESDDAGAFAVYSLNGKGSIEVKHESMQSFSDTFTIISNMEKQVFLSRGAVLSGRIVDESGEPLEEAEISIKSYDDFGDTTGEKEIETDEDGNFILEGIRPGNVQLAVHHAGKLPLQRMIAIQEQVSITQTFTLVNGLTIAGTVTHADGTPAEDIEVSIEDDDYEERIFMLAFMGDDTVVVEDGRFEITGLATGEYDVVFSLEDSYVPLYTEKDIAAGSTNLVVVLPRTVPYAVLVTDTDGEPVTEAEIQVYRFEEEEWMPAVSYREDLETDDAGKADIKVRSGERYKVIVNKAGYLPGKVMVDIPDSVDETENEISVQLANGLVLSGIVVNKQNGEPLADVSVVADGIEPERADDELVKTDETGMFEIKGVPLGVLTVYVIQKDEDDDVQVVFQKQIVVNADSALDKLRLEVETPGIVKGSVLVTGDQAAEMRGIVLVDLDSQRPAYQEETDDDGTFVIDDVKPGVYNAVAFIVSGDGVQTVGSPVQLNVVSGVTNELTIGEAQKKSGLVVTGSVVLDDKPVPDASIVMVPEPDKPLDKMEMMTLGTKVKQITTDGDGVLTVEDISPGPYLVLVQKMNYRDKKMIEFSTRILVTADTTNFNIIVSGTTLTGELKGPDGKPVPESIVVLRPAGKDALIQGMTGRNAESDENGIFLIPYLEEGVYDIKAHSEDKGILSVYDVTVTGQVTKVALAFAQPVSLHGSVTNYAGDVYEDTYVLIADRDGQIVTAEEVEDDGTYAIENEISPGIYSIIVVNEGYSVTVVERDLRTNSIFNADLRLAGSAVITLSGDSEKIKDRIVRFYDSNNNEVVRLRKRELALVPKYNVFNISPTDTNGKTEIQGLPEGTYTISVDGSEQKGTVTIVPLEEQTVTLKIE
jgi:uncharacterized GH25 family protein/5-hydroxyisourate hydrolase-like protein (transthyretin family)